MNFNKMCWRRKTNYILPPELNQIIMEFSDGYPGMKQKLQRLHRELMDPNYIHVYTIVGQIAQPWNCTVYCSREWIESVRDDVLEDAEIAENHNNLYVLDYTEEVANQMNRQQVKIVVNTPAAMLRWKTEPFLN